MFSGLSSLVIDNVTDLDGVIVVRARTAGGPVACPRCSGRSGQVHGYCERTVADVPADGRPVVVRVRVRRMRCPVPGCPVQTFREQVPGVLGRYQRRTTRLACQAGEVARRLAGRAGAGLLAALGVPLSRHTALRLLLRLALPEVAVPRVLGVDDFALRRGQVYATILIDAETGQRVDVLASWKADVREAWLRGHPGVQIVCRDGSGAYGEAVRRALPGAVQAGDRWHLWHSLAEAVLKEVAAHSTCWAAAGPPLNYGRQAATTAERWRQVHDLTDRGTGLLECSRRLGLSLNTVKRYARAAEPERMIRAPRYRATMVDLYRDHLRARRAADPAVPVWQLLAEIRAQGYPGSMNLLYRYITQGRVEADRPHLSPRRVTRLLLTRPDALSDSQQTLLAGLTDACPEMTSLAALLRPESRQRGPAQGLGRDRPGQRPPAFARLHPRPGPGQAGRHRRRHPAVSQRPDRRREHQDQDDQAADVRPRRIHPAAPPHPARLTPRTVTTESATEPLDPQSRGA